MKKCLYILFLTWLTLDGCATFRTSRSSPVLKQGGEGYREEGIASWYGRGFHGRRTASGEKFNLQALTCAHRTLPFGTAVKVTNLENQKTVIVTVNDRGPAIRSRLVDLSMAAARALDMIRSGVARVRMEGLSLGETL